MMTAAPSSALPARRLALIAVLIQLTYTLLAHGYAWFGLPQSAAMREALSTPQFLAQFAATTVATLAVVGLVVWSTMHRWLARHATQAVDEPRKLYGTFISLLLLFTLTSSAGIAILQSRLMEWLLANRDVLDGWFGQSFIGKMIALNVLIKLLTILTDIIGAWAVVRIAAWTVRPAGPAGGPEYGRSHAAWIAGLVVLIWQLNASTIVGGYLHAQSPEAGGLAYALGYLVMPAAVLALCARACLKILPPDTGRAGPGRAAIHGTLAFWIAQGLGIGLGYLSIKAMTWSQLVRVAQSQMTVAVLLLAYGALLVVGCRAGKLALYRGANAPSRQA
ncbi:hypothetical protein VCS63_10205 [Achromobacter sp. D10]|uniref:hypothetical protein n=1 Tax=Achromobacter sp. D10 TaxID=3110765 RepID=UPI002B4A97EB|nr:hypothetical protein [Achromobacter sp. D10]MEB3096191.1 hypothetical protein [Achromobacter sp. D10]